MIQISVLYFICRQKARSISDLSAPCCIFHDQQLGQTKQDEGCVEWMA
jgi:hypothetical protein